MKLRIVMRLVPAIALLSLLGAGTAQAFCFLKKHERRMDYGSLRIPAIGFSPTVFRDYPSYSPLPVYGRYGGPVAQPERPDYDNRYGSGSEGVLRY